MKKSKTQQSTRRYDPQFVAAAVLAFVALVFLSVGLYAFKQAQPTGYIQGVYALGTPIVAGEATAIINNVRYDQGHRPFEAPSGKQYIIVDTTFQNNTEKPIAILPSNQTYIKDTSSTVYYLSPMGLEEPFRAGELLPGDKIRGELSYLVPKDTAYTLYIDAIWSGGVVSVTLRQ